MMTSSASCFSHNDDDDDDKSTIFVIDCSFQRATAAGNEQTKKKRTDDKTSTANALLLTFVVNHDSHGPHGSATPTVTSFSLPVVPLVLAKKPPCQHSASALQVV
jgi:hypothetical protein